MDDRTLLAQRHLSVVSSEPDPDLAHIAQVIGHGVTVDGRAGLEAMLGRLLGAVEHSAVVAKTLDLIGHTRTTGALLALGDWLIDGADPATTALFRGLAERAVLPRLGVHTLRLLGCHSACSPAGQATMRRLAELLGLEVCGASQLLHAGHYEAGGFGDCWSFLLVSAGELGERATRGSAPAGAEPRVLDLAALPAVALGEHLARYPRCIATEQTAQQILQLVRRSAGAPMAGVAAAPSLELALPSTRPGAYHIAHVVLNGAFLQFYPDGMTRTGIAFPVDNAAVLCGIVAALQARAAIR